MKKKQGKRRHRSRAEGLSLGRRWQQSGLSQWAFAKQEGISAGTLNYWAHQIEAEPSQVLRNFFIVPQSPTDSVPQSESMPITQKEGFDKETSEPSQVVDSVEACFEAQVGDLVVRVPVSAGYEALIAAVQTLSKGR